MKSNSKKRIFISHSTLDAPIGEEFLDALIELGIDKNDVFYSSKYHTGVKLGRDFHNSVYEALHNCEIVVFLLTRSFYKSEFCINEMGAVWYSDKPFIPILLDNLTYEDMKGFIDNHYVACKPEISDSYKLLSELNQFIVNPKDIDVELIFKNFVKIANNTAEKTSKLLPVESDFISKTEKMILTNRFTEGEILLFNFFIEFQNNVIRDSYEYDPLNKTSTKSLDLIQIEQYSRKSNFDYSKAKSLLYRSNLLKYHWEEFSDDYFSCELNIEIFRDLLSLSSRAKEIIESIKVKYEAALSGSDISQSNEMSHLIKDNFTNFSDIENIILNPKFKEIEALLFQYMIDTATISLGDRWMADGQKSDIKTWEDTNNLNNKLSSNYESALKLIKFRNLVEIASCTSYGNPREYKLKDEYSKQLSSLHQEAQTVLDTVIKNNAYEFPF